MTRASLPPTTSINSAKIYIPGTIINNKNNCFFLFACFCATLPTFRFSFFVFLFFLFLFFSCIPVCFIFFVSLRLCSSRLLLSASAYFILRVLSACVICTLHLGILVFFIRLVFFFVALRARPNGEQQKLKTKPKSKEQTLGVLVKTRMEYKRRTRVTNKR